MNKLINRAKTLGKELAYSPTGRYLARQALKASEDGMLRSAINDRGLDYTLRRIASEHLESGVYFAKLTINNWRALDGKPFRLLHKGKLVYGNQIEPPARGFPLEYRNIMVPSDNLNEFSLDIETPYTLKIGKGAFTTPEQLKYDAQYEVQQHGDVFYSLRGNLQNPKRILLTFPGFGPSTTRISYAVSYMKALTDHDLKDTLMICFQDRYLAAGSYMMVDNSGRPLYKRVKQVIDSFVSRFNIKDENMMFFGASKGGSIAITYAKEFPAAQLLLAVPQMNLPYYFNKPFFRDNLFQNDALSRLEQPQDALLRYFDEGRRIDYFYTNDDELSNRSIIEFAKDIPNLTKYRVNGVHGAVARAALPAMLNIIRRFLTPQEHRALEVTQIRQYSDESSTRVQVRLKAERKMSDKQNLFLEGSLGRTIFRQIMSQGEPEFMAYLAEDQKLLHNIDSLSKIHSVTAMAEDGTIRTGAIAEKLDVTNVDEAKTSVDKSPIHFDSKSPQIYNIVDNDQFEQFEYISAPIKSSAKTLEVRLVNDFSPEAFSSPAMDTGQIFCLKVNGSTSLLNLFIVRAVIDARLERVLVRVAETVDSDELRAQFDSIEWEKIEVQK